MKRILLVLSVLFVFTLSYAQTIYIKVEAPQMNWERNSVVFNVSSTNTIQSDIKIDVRVDGAYNNGSKVFDIYSSSICQSGQSFWTFEVPLTEAPIYMWQVDFVCDVTPSLPCYEDNYVYEETSDSFVTENFFWNRYR